MLTLLQMLSDLVESGNNSIKLEDEKFILIIGDDTVVAPTSTSKSKTMKRSARSPQS